MKTKRATFLVFAVLVVVTAVTVLQTLPPFPLPANAPASEFSAERALNHIRAIAQQPHPTGSAANDAVRAYILDQLKSLGIETDTQREGNLENVVGRIEGTRSSDAVLLTAHLDSVAEAPGAADDGSGVAALLETARALVANGPMPNTVMFLFTDNEESGLIGAEAFITHHPWTKDVRVVVGFDAGGLSGPGVLSTTSANDGWLIRQVAQADPSFTGSSIITAFADSGTDFGHAFRPAGYSGYAFDLYWDRRIHTPDDNLDHVNLSSVQHQGYHALFLARHFATLDSLQDPREPDVVYFNVLRLFTVTYSSAWAFPLAIAVAVVFCGVFVFGLRRRLLTWKGVGFGSLVLLMGLVIAPLPSILLDRSMPGVPFQFIGRAIDQPASVSAVVLVTLVLTVLWYVLARRVRSTSVYDLTLGALAVMLGSLIGTSIVVPALSFVLTWPLLFSLLACANWFYWSAQQKGSITVILALLAAGAANIIILGPTILLGLFDQLPLALVLVGVLCGFLVPLIHLMLGGIRVNADLYSI